jgi:3D-(3,5/4)-trihydroxycyclohexane-1,2-dione acylhydrolase (decyclizing)
MATIRLTAAQAIVRFLVAQRVLLDGRDAPLFAGCWAIFGHGNVAGMGEALFHARDALPTLRAHNEQAMALAAVAFAKARNRRQMMACTSSIGPGAMNMLTAAGVAHVNRLPVLLLPGDVFAGRRPDPVLQQIEDWGDGTISANDCFRPVSRYWDRITRPEQLVTALPRAVAVLIDPAQCGPVTLSLCQDVQAEAHDFPAALFDPLTHRSRRPAPDAAELAHAVHALRRAERPLIVAGGGVLYAEAAGTLQDFAARHGIPVAETQAGKGALPWNHPCAVGAIGVTGSSAANTLAREADIVLAVGTRLQDFTTGSRALLPGGKRLIQLNIQPFDAGKHGAMPLVGDARTTLDALTAALGDHASGPAWQARAAALTAEWTAVVDAATTPGNAALPSDAQVLGAVNRAARPGDVVVCAAGGLPGELHKLWRSVGPGGYHLEYGFSCMGYEIAGGLGVKIAHPDREVFVMVGDGSYLMMNSELQTSVMLGRKLIVTVLDNRGYGCINRLQRACGSEPFNNLIADVDGANGSWVDFAAHARSLGARAEAAASLAELEAALARARDADRTCVITIETDPLAVTQAGGAWWDVTVPEVSPRAAVQEARAAYVEARRSQGGVA